MMVAVAAVPVVVVVVVVAATVVVVMAEGRMHLVRAESEPRADGFGPVAA